MELSGRNMACKKRRYDSEWEAMADLNRVAPVLGDFTMQPYLCRSCGRWHNGHLNKADKERNIRMTELTNEIAILSKVVQSNAAKARLAGMKAELRNLATAKSESTSSKAHTCGDNG